MTLPKYSWLIFLAIAAASSLPAAEITGKVRDASGDNATVVIDGEALPAIGDRVEIFFKLPGAEEDISVATGTVAAVDAKLVKIKIESATGSVEKDQLARIKSASPQKAPAAASASSPSAGSGKSATASSIRGDWVGTFPDGGKLSLSFKDDGTFLWIGESKGSAETMRGKYRLDYAVRPHRIDGFDFEPAHPDGMFRGVFELQDDGRLRLDLSPGKQAEPAWDFTDGAVNFSRATSPIVPPPDKKSADVIPKPATTVGSGPARTPGVRGQLLFEHDFETPAPITTPLSLDGTGIVLKHVSGEGQITAEKGVGAAMFDKSVLKKFVAECDMRPASAGPDASYGFIVFPMDFKSGDPIPSNFYHLLFDPNENEVYFEGRKGSWHVDESQPLPPGSLKIGRANRISLEVDETQVTVFLDGNFAVAFQHEGLFEGRLGLVAGGDSSCVVHFDNLRIFARADGKSASTSLASPAAPTVASSPPEQRGKDAPTPSLSAPVEGAPSEAARYSVEGLAKMDAKDFKGAIATYNKWIELDPTNPKPYANRGSAYNVLKQSKRALADLNEALRLDPSISMAYVIRGNIYADLHQLKRAIKDYEEAIRLDLKNISAYYARGTVYVELGQAKRAIEDFSQAIALKPTYKEAYWNRSVCYKAIGKAQLAKRDFDRFQELKAEASSSSPPKPAPVPPDL